MKTRTAAALLALGLALSLEAQAATTSRLSSSTQVGTAITTPTPQPRPRLTPTEQPGVTPAPDVPLSSICSPGILDRVIQAGPSPSRQNMLALIRAAQQRLCPGGGNGRRSSHQLEVDPGSDNSQQ